MDLQFDATLKDCPGMKACRNPKTPGKSCGECPRGKDAPEVIDVGWESEAVRRTARLIAESRGGYAQEMSDLSPIEWELMLLWQQREEIDQRSCLGDVAELKVMIREYIGARLAFKG